MTIVRDPARVSYKLAFMATRKTAQKKAPLQITAFPLTPANGERQRPGGVADFTTLGIHPFVDDSISSIRFSYGLTTTLGTPDGSAVGVDNIKVVTVPEPSSLALVLGALAVWGVRRTRFSRWLRSL